MCIAGACSGRQERTRLLAQHVFERRHSTSYKLYNHCACISHRRNRRASAIGRLTRRLRCSAAVVRRDDESNRLCLRIYSVLADLGAVAIEVAPDPGPDMTLKAIARTTFRDLLATTTTRSLSHHRGNARRGCGVDPWIAACGYRSRTRTPAWRGPGPASARVAIEARMHTAWRSKSGCRAACAGPHADAWQEIRSFNAHVPGHRYNPSASLRAPYRRAYRRSPAATCSAQRRPRSTAQQQLRGKLSTNLSAVAAAAHAPARGRLLSRGTRYTSLNMRTEQRSLHAWSPAGSRGTG
jgi:hypothetical protein